MSILALIGAVSIVWCGARLFSVRGKPTPWMYPVYRGTRK